MRIIPAINSGKKIWSAYGQILTDPHSKPRAWLSSKELLESEQKQFDKRTKGIHICYCSLSRARNLNELWPTTMTPKSLFHEQYILPVELNLRTKEYKFIMQYAAVEPGSRAQPPTRARHVPYNAVCGENKYNIFLITIGLRKCAF